jgi:Mg2+ and Co2+ transporter CorA
LRLDAASRRVYRALAPTSFPGPASPRNSPRHGLRVADYLEEQRDSIVWVDLFNPTKEEETAVETVFGIAVPTREEMEEIEVSSRLYVEDGGYFMTANLPSQTEADKPEMSPVTFALANKRLVTVVAPAPTPSWSACSRRSSTGWPISSKRSAATSRRSRMTSSRRPPPAPRAATATSRSS